MLKRLFDVIVSALGLVVTAPIMALIAVAIKLDSPGPVLYRAPRVGRGVRMFTMYKFRTMVADTANRGPALTAQDDPRITRVGNLLRRTKLDELPQLWNVLLGDMSLVGPRPEVAEYFVRFPPDSQDVLSVRPGITGLAQIKFRHEERLLAGPNPDERYLTAILPEKLAIDRYYVANQSFGLDLKILVQTALVLFKS